jgi:hypothetical protein
MTFIWTKLRFKERRKNRFRGSMPVEPKKRRTVDFSVVIELEKC